MRNFQQQVKKAFCYHKLLWAFANWINCSRDLKHFANSQPSVSNFNSFSRSLKQFVLTVGHSNFGNKIPMLCLPLFYFEKSHKIFWFWKTRGFISTWFLTLSVELELLQHWFVISKFSLTQAYFVSLLEKWEIDVRTDVVH